MQDLSELAGIKLIRQLFHIFVVIIITQAPIFTTLETGQDEQIIDYIEGEYKEIFLLNYVFPTYSVDEASPLCVPSRREIDHGKLAWRALKRSLPIKEEFPYTTRVVSEISESNGSSSMATV